MQNHNYNTVKSLTHFPFIVAGQDAVRSGGDPSFKKMFDSGEGKQLKVLNISSEEVQVMNNHANIAYLIELEYNMDGKKPSAKCASASTWLKENNHWVCGLHTESQLKNLG